MTFDDVVQAKTRLEAQGQTPSANKILAALGTGSKKTVLKHLRALAGVPGPRPRPAPPLVPVARPDPVPAVRLPAAPALERRAPVVDPVAAAEAQLQDARDALMHAKLSLMATRDLAIDGVLRGSLHPADVLHEQALDDVVLCKREYDLAWQALTEARQQAAQRQAAQQQARREAWVAAHHPALVAELQRAQETFTRVQALPEDAAKVRAHNTARMVLHNARMAYNAALAQAPTTNGSTA